MKVNLGLLTVFVSRSMLCVCSLYALWGQRNCAFLSRFQMVHKQYERDMVAIYCDINLNRCESAAAVRMLNAHILYKYIVYVSQHIKHSKNRYKKLTSTAKVIISRSL